MHEIKTKAERRNMNLSEIRVEDTLQKHKNARSHLDKLKQSDESNWQDYKTRLDSQLNDIDEDLRKVLAYFGQ